MWQSVAFDIQRPSAALVLMTESPIPVYFSRPQLTSLIERSRIS